MYTHTHPIYGDLAFCNNSTNDINLRFYYTRAGYLVCFYDDEVTPINCATAIKEYNNPIPNYSGSY